MKGNRNRDKLNTIAYEFPKNINSKFPMKRLPYISTMDLIYNNSRDDYQRSKFKSSNTHK